MRRECLERFPRHRGLAIPSCMPGSLTRGFLWSRWRGKCSRYSRRMRNPQFYVFGKRPMPWYHYVHRREHTSRSRGSILQGSLHIWIKFPRSFRQLKLILASDNVAWWYIIQWKCPLCFMFCQNDVIDRNIFRVTGHLCREFNDDRWIPHTKASYAELGCFLWFAPE